MRKLDEEATASTADIRAVIPPQKTQDSGLNLPTMLLGALCVLLAIIAIVLAAVSMNRQNVYNIGAAQGTSGGGNDGPAAGKTWLIMIGHDYGAHEYIDVEGNLAGYHHDLIREVCAAAGLNCRTVWDSYPNCWDSQAGQHGKGGQGLMNGWYDACTGWSRTRLRDGTFSFSKAFLPTHPPAFYVRRGNPGNFNVNDVSGKKIVFMDGWVDDEKCLARQSSITGSVLPADKILHVTETDAFQEKISTGEVDAGWAAGTFISQGYVDESVIQILSPTSPQTCMLDGSAMMTRKDNNFTVYWNQGFDKLVESGRFTRLCSEASQRHGRVGTVSCLNV
ncbi:PREDICTED: uncharacterized protein LOC109478836 [Branchiostoma belcheri]|uniref:Uncharacterized protein LOC109478836 n=1 Tax=Branchiostoma belcheri TaxID=7741 RepID=A0A6P4ZZ20_BRABE|nr:PREDICTED: uncharacterized protein LOC109478836 [Branchiostoma belcheri]